MMRSLFSGVAGLKTHQVKMDVIGNNIANVNTVGYKTSNVTFQDLVYQTKANASGPNDNTGRAGVNAQQIGLGVSTGSIYSNVTGAGSAETTGNPFDIRINGDSFFVVSDGSQQFYTRSGAFTVDANGTLCMSSNGYTVMGYGVTDNNGVQQINTSSLVALKIMSPANKVSDPDATSKGYITGILDANSDALTQDAGQVIDMKLYDNEGYRYTVKYKILPKLNDAQEPVKGQYKLAVSDMIDSNGDTIFRDQDTAGGESDTDYALAKIKFFSRMLNSGDTAERGNSLTATNDKTDTGYPGTAYIDVKFDTKTGAFVSTTADSNTSNAGFNLNLHSLLGIIEDPGATGDPADQIRSIPTDAFTKNVEVDTTTMQNIDNKGTSTVNGGNGGVDTTEGSGWSVGKLSSISIGVDGKITGAYTNGQTKLLGQIASAIFSNASGLEKTGDNLYNATMNSGDAILGDVTANGGSYASGELEMSNVDLSSEFTSMITTQRGFQANSRIITVSDSMLEELINLKR
ncbi:MAG: flagellar hook-basal body complex protein [Lachnospiraceae bacterium]|nr:flagellar hook-basal body complex protein [Lachnospiraceae bacterium]